MENLRRSKFFIKNVLVLIVLIATADYTAAQFATPVKWSFVTNRINDCEYELVFKAKIDKPWHLYSLQSHGSKGPLPTTFTFYKQEQYMLVNSVIEDRPMKKKEKLWKRNVYFFEEEVVFKQRVKLKTNQSILISGNVEFMVGNGNQCLAPSTVSFEFGLLGTAACADSSGLSRTGCTCDSTNNKKELPILDAEEVSVSWWNFWCWILWWFCTILFPVEDVLMQIYLNTCTAEGYTEGIPFIFGAISVE